MDPGAFMLMRAAALAKLPTSVQSLLLVWSKPYAVGCMSITSAFASGYREESCHNVCATTPLSPLFDSAGWLPADTIGWWPAMLLPSADVNLARQIVDRGIASDGTRPPGTLYLVSTSDRHRNVRSAEYPDAVLALSPRLRIARVSTPVLGSVTDAIGYFTGVRTVEELPHVHFRPGAVADHLTSEGGMLDGHDQMPALNWLKQGATASYGSVSEPCSFVEKFPDVRILFEHYSHGETLLEAYWKSVSMPTQGIFIGDALARPFADREN